MKYYIVYEVTLLIVSVPWDVKIPNYKKQPLEFLAHSSQRNLPYGLPANEEVRGPWEVVTVGIRVDVYECFSNRNLLCIMMGVYNNITEYIGCLL